MKRLVQVQEIEGDGLEALLGKEVLIMCLNYFYTGKLVGVNTHDIILTEPAIVYSTGKMSEKGFSEVEKIPVSEWRIRTAAIESYGEV